MNTQLVLKSVTWAFVFMLVVPVLGSTIMMLNTTPVGTLAALYLLASIYYWKNRQPKFV